MGRIPRKEPGGTKTKEFPLTFNQKKNLILAESFDADGPFKSAKERKQAFLANWPQNFNMAPGVRPAAWWAYANKGGERQLITFAKFIFNGEECSEPEYESGAAFLVRTGQATDADTEMFIKIHTTKFDRKEEVIGLHSYMQDVYDHELAILQTLKDDPKWKDKVETLLA